MFPPLAPNILEIIRRLWQPWWVPALSLLVVVILTPLMRSLATRWQIYDRPSGLLKPHVKPIPYLGGVAVFMAWVVPLLIWTFIGQNEHSLKIIAIIFGGAILLGLGLVDDLKDIKPTYRLLGEVAVAVGLFAAGVQFKAIPQITIEGITFFHPGSIEAALAGLLVQILLIAGASNAINLLDGLDGLCSGVIVIIAVGFLLVATHIGAWAERDWCTTELVGSDYRFNKLVVVIAMALSGAALGFLLYNYNPATIFLGDAGSTFLGYLLAVLIILFSDKAGLTKWFLAGLMIMALPIFDTGLALVRRIRNKRPIFGGDRSHFYDQLVDKGLSVRATVAVCYGLAILAVVVAVGSLALRARYMFAVYAGIAVLVVVLITSGGFIKVDRSSLKSPQGSAELPKHL